MHSEFLSVCQSRSMHSEFLVCQSRSMHSDFLVLIIGILNSFMRNLVGGEGIPGFLQSLYQSLGADGDKHHFFIFMLKICLKYGGGGGAQTALPSPKKYYHVAHAVLRSV